MLTRANHPPERIAEDAVRLPGSESGAARPRRDRCPPTPAAATAPSHAATTSPRPAETTPSHAGLATIKGDPPRRAGRTPCASRSSSTAKCRSTTSASRIRHACSSICPARARRTTLVDQTIRFEGDADIVRQVRVGRHPNNTTRVVLDAAGVTSYSVYPLYSPYRLVIDCVRVPAAVAAAAMTDKVLARVPPAATPQASQSNEVRGGSPPAPAARSAAPRAR